MVENVCYSTVIVHDYDINKESYNLRMDDVISVLVRLDGYKISMKRWIPQVVKEYQRSLVDVMRWQTLSLEQRDFVYLNQKGNRLSNQEVKLNHDKNL